MSQIIDMLAKGEGHRFGKYRWHSGATQADLLKEYDGERLPYASMGPHRLNAAHGTDIKAGL
jgi:hypothetical protein